MGTIASASPVAVVSNDTDAKPRHVRTQVVVDGRIENRTERVPRTRYLKVVKPSGSVSRIPVHNGRANTASGDEYKQWIEHWKLEVTGSIRYDRCPQTLSSEIMHGYLPSKWFGPDVPIIPEHIRDRSPCSKSVNGTRIDANNPCKCVEELIAWRKDWQAKRMANIEHRNQMLEAAKAQSDAAAGMVEAVKGVVDVVKDLQERATAPKRGARSTGGDE